MNNVIFSVLSIMIMSNVQALEVQKSKVKYIAPWQDHIDIKMHAPEVDAGCGATNLYRVDLQNDPAAREKYAALLAA